MSEATVAALLIAISLCVSGAATACYGIIVEKTLEQLRRSSHDTEFLATHDQLTGLPNRHAYYQKNAEFKEADFESGIIFYALDLNGFKAVNDTYGHFVGDELLKQVAERITSLLSDSDWAARMGGDEFIVISPYGSDTNNRFALASQIISKISEPIELGELCLNLSTSVGIAYSPEHGRDLNTLANHADLALFAAKSKTHRRWHIFDSDLKAQSERRRRIEERLRCALKDQSLDIHFQPFIDHMRNQIVGFEALARWTDSELGEVPPTEFIAVAETCGMISEIGDYVLRLACEEAAGWQAPPTSPAPRIAVNVSPHQFSSEAFPALVARVLEEFGLDPRRLELEITETALMSDTKRAIKSLKALDELGVSVAVDDFGTGHSSLSYLKLFPIDRLKIDRSFVRDIENDANDLAIVKAVVGLARSMELQVIAEGIENHQQAKILRSMGCIEMQGFLFSRSIKADRVQAFIDTYSKQQNIVPHAPQLQKLLSA